VSVTVRVWCVPIQRAGNASQNLFLNNIISRNISKYALLFFMGGPLQQFMIERKILKVASLLSFSSSRSAPLTRNNIVLSKYIILFIWYYLHTPKISPFAVQKRRPLQSFRCIFSPPPPRNLFAADLVQLTPKSHIFWKCSVYLA